LEGKKSYRRTRTLRRRNDVWRLWRANGGKRERDSTKWLLDIKYREKEIIEKKKRERRRLVVRFKRHEKEDRLREKKKKDDNGLSCTHANWHTQMHTQKNSPEKRCAQDERENKTDWERGNSWPAWPCVAVNKVKEEGGEGEKKKKRRKTQEVKKDENNEAWEKKAWELLLFFFDREFSTNGKVFNLSNIKLKTNYKLLKINGNRKCHHIDLPDFAPCCPYLGDASRSWHDIFDCN